MFSFLLFCNGHYFFYKSLKAFFLSRDIGRNLGIDLTEVYRAVIMYLAAKQWLTWVCGLVKHANKEQCFTEKLLNHGIRL